MPIDNENKDMRYERGMLPEPTRYKDGSYRRGRGCAKQDPFWYAKDETTTKLLATIPWVEDVGDRIPGAYGDSVPGFLRYPIRHTLPYTASFDDWYKETNSLTTAVNLMFQQLAEGFSTDSLSFEATDVIMCLFAAASLAAYIEEGRRSFGLRKKFSLYNNYWGKELTSQTRLNHESVSSGQADFVTDVNLLISEFNEVIRVPLPWFVHDRWDFLARHLFVDAEAGDYVTIFATVMDKLLVIDGDRLSTGTCLIAKDTPVNQTTAEFLDTVRDALTRLRRQDFRDIFAWIGKVYDKSQCLKIEDYDLAYETQVHRNDIVSTAFHNGIYLQDQKWQITGDVTDISASPRPISLIDDVAVYQTNGRLYCQPIGYCGTGAEPNHVPAYDEILIDTFGQNPSPGNILDITACLCVPFVPNGQVSVGEPRIVQFVGQGVSQVYLPVACRTELFMEPHLTFTYETGEIKTEKINLCDTSLDYSRWFSHLTHVNSAPLFRLLSRTTPTKAIPGSVEYDATTGSGTFSSGGKVLKGCERYFGEIDVYTSISPTYLKKLHEKCVYRMIMPPPNAKSLTK
jgi:hypothetical protein